MAVQIVLFVAGLTLLYFGAEWLVRGAARIAVALGITPVVVGLTIVAIGTSAPELVVSALSAWRGDVDVALGNVVGSNVVNVALILGLAAVIHPLAVTSSLVRREIPIMVAAALAVPATAWDGVISRLEGLVLLTASVAYIWAAVALGRRAPADQKLEYHEFEEAQGLEPKGEPLLADALLVAVGIVALAAGAHLTVTAAVVFARAAGISELLVGLTVVAIGTSLPELATSVLAAVRKQADIAVANVVGSNIINVFLILGASAGIRQLEVDPSLMRLEIPAMVALTLLLVPFAATGSKVQRWEGAVLLAAYVAFTAAVIVVSVQA